MVLVEIPSEFEQEIKSWKIDLQTLFVSFLKREFNKIKRFSKLVEQSADESKLKQFADDIDEELLWNLSNEVLKDSRLTDEKIDELADELKECVAKKHLT